MEVINAIYSKLKKYDKHSCFGKNINSLQDAAKSVLLYGNPDQISKYLVNKYKDLSSIVYVTVPITGTDDFDNSLEIFSKNVRV